MYVMFGSSSQGVPLVFFGDDLTLGQGRGGGEGEDESKGTHVLRKSAAPVSVKVQTAG